MAAATAVFEDARNGILIGSRLDNWLRLNPGLLNSQDPATGWTLLGTAVASGFPRQVEQLLKKGANARLYGQDGESPLLLATWKAPRERARLVQILLPYVPKESLDDTCALAGNSTPLMFAAERTDADAVRILAKAGARLNIKNDDGDTAKDIALRTGKTWLVKALTPDVEQSIFGRIVSGVVSVTRHVVAWVDEKFSGFMGRMFGFRGQRRRDLDRRLSDGPQEPSPEVFVQKLDDMVKDTPVLETFFKNDKRFLQDMAEKLVDLANDPTTDLGTPEVLPKTIKVTMHQQVIYCDDSSSMTNAKGRREGRWEGQKRLAQRIVRTTTRILPEGMGVAVRFINQTADNSMLLDSEGVGRVISSISPQGDTAIGTTLRDRILRPLVFEPLARKELRRPLLVSILTDGGPSKEDKDMLAKVIVQCGDELANKGYPRDCVKFLIGQIGSSDEAVAFLESLSNNPAIQSVSHIFAGRLDDKFRTLHDERGLDRWLVETLFEPLRAAERRRA